MQSEKDCCSRFFLGHMHTCQGTTVSAAAGATSLNTDTTRASVDSRMSFTGMPPRAPGSAGTRRLALGY